MQFQDYYKTLEVERSATQDEIKKSYRRLSKKFHPDMNAANHDATERFKRIGEAYEVLKDPDKRKKYDQLGQHWNNPSAQAGAAGANPYAGWQNVDWNQAGGPGGPGGRGRGGQPSGFSDFFDTFFAQQGGFAGGADPFAAGEGDGARQRAGQRRGRDPFGGARDGEDAEVEITIPLEDVVDGVQKTITLQQTVTGPDGGRRVEEKSYTVKIPAGTVNGGRIRLKGEGTKGRGGGKDGDLFLKVALAPHARFVVVDGHDLTARLPVAPWEAATGAKVPFMALDGEVKLTLPKLSTSGAKLRLKGKGLPKKDGERGNITVEIVVVTPTDLKPEELELLDQWQKLRDGWDPRAPR